MLNPETVSTAIASLGANKLARIIATGASAEEIAAAHDCAKNGLAAGLSPRAREVHAILCTHEGASSTSEVDE